MRSETHRGLICVGLRVGQGTALLAPVLGLLVFWLFAFKPAVTLYIVVTGLAVALLKVVEQARLSVEIEEIVRRTLYGKQTH